MKRVTIVGAVDKRLIVYPLMHVLGLTGKTILVTDDGNLRRFGDTYEKEFSKGINDVRVVQEVSERVEEKGEYDFEVYVTTNEIVDESDLVVYCHGLHKTFATEPVIEKFEELESKQEVLVTASRVKEVEKGVTRLEISKDTIGYVCDCEEHKDFIACNNSVLAKVGAYLFGDFTGLGQEGYIKVLKRVE